MLVYGTIPVWDSSVWDPLQNRDYVNAEKSLATIFGEYDTERWKNIYWAGLLNGIPLFRGDLTLGEWQSDALPLVVRTIRKTISASV